MNNPLVSVIVPTYDRYLFLGETLDSVVAQSYENWECIVVDDGSNDFTGELMEFYCNRNSKIKYHKRPRNRPKGANSCRNYGLELSKGKYIQWLDSDDIISHNKIESQVELLESVNGEIVTAKWGRFSNLQEEQIFHDCQTYRNFESSKSFFSALAKTSGYYPIHAYLITRALHHKAGPWLEYLTINQDGEYIARVIANSSKINYSDVGWALYRKTQGVKTSRYDENKLQDLVTSWTLIESYLKIRYKEGEIDFVNNAKAKIYYVCQNWPQVIKDNKEFFSGIPEKNILKKIIKRTKWYINNLHQKNSGKIFSSKKNAK